MFKRESTVRKYPASSSSDSSDDDDPVNFKRAKRSNRISPPRNNLQTQRFPTKSGTSTTTTSISLKPGGKANVLKSLDEVILDMDMGGALNNGNSSRTAMGSVPTYGNRNGNTSRTDMGGVPTYGNRNGNSNRTAMGGAPTYGNRNGNSSGAVININTTANRNGCEFKIPLKEKKDMCLSDIISYMNMPNGKGLATHMKVTLEPEQPKFNLEDFENRIRQLGILTIDIDDGNRSSPRQVSAQEEIAWMPFLPPRDVTFDTLMSWMNPGNKLTDVDPEYYLEFITRTLYMDVVACKKLYQNVPQALYQEVRAKANLFETVGKGPFICRAAMKMANLDAILGFELTNPKTKDDKPTIGHNELLYFADVCAGPGGFTEYMLWKKKWEAKGFGFTLKGDLDFDTGSFTVSGPESFEAFYGPAKDGNVYNPDNVSAYVHHIICHSDGKGVHLMMADGGFEVSKQESLQEVLSSQIILSQCYVALGAVRTGGHFICKLFDVFTPFTVGLVYLMYLSFESVAIHKPHTSRPANSERYLICKWKKQSAEPIFMYLRECHDWMWKNCMKEEKDQMSLLELVPMKIISSPINPFYKYICDSNKKIAQLQISTMTQMIRYLRDRELTNEQQVEAKTKAFQYWQVPEKIPKPSYGMSTEKACKYLLDSLPLTMLKREDNELVANTLEPYLQSPYDWRFVIVQGSKGSCNRGFYMSMGRHMVYRFGGGNWILCTQQDPNIELAKETLVYGEFVDEIYGKAVADQVIVKTFSIIDALVLGGHDVRQLHYTQRLEFASKFADSMTKSGTVPIRVKSPIRVENISSAFEKFDYRVIKGYGKGSSLICPIDPFKPECPMMKPGGLLFMKITLDPWQMVLDRQAMKKFWINKSTSAFSYQVPEDAISGFFYTMSQRVMWNWDKETNVLNPTFHPEDSRLGQLNPTRVHAFTILNYVKYVVNKVAHSPPKSSPPKQKERVPTPQ